MVIVIVSMLAVNRVVYGASGILSNYTVKISTVFRGTSRIGSEGRTTQRLTYIEKERRCWGQRHSPLPSGGGYTSDKMRAECKCKWSSCEDRPTWSLTRTRQVECAETAEVDRTRRHVAGRLGRCGGWDED